MEAGQVSGMAGAAVAVDWFVVAAIICGLMVSNKQFMAVLMLRAQPFVGDYSCPLSSFMFFL